MTPRIPPLPIEERDPRTEELLAPLRQGGGRELNIFATLAHHPKLLKRWSVFGGTLLYGGRLDGRDRELLILRTAQNCHAEYEWHQHVPIAKAAGVTEEEIARVVVGLQSDEWTENDRSLIAAADELHDAACISDATWEQLASRYDPQQLIEICMVVGQYHLVAFTLNSLGIEIEEA